MAKLQVTVQTMLIGAAALASMQAHAVDIAKVNGKVINDRDVRSALGNMNEGQREGFLQDLNSRKLAVSGVIDQEVLVQEGEKSKLDQDAEYKEALNAFRRQFLVTRVLQKNIGNKVTEKAAEKYYNAHKNRYRTDQVRAFHILARDEGKGREFMAKAKGLDEDKFQELAERISEDPSAKNNRGDLGFITRTSKVDEFTTPVFAAKEGETIGPIKTIYGYHVVKIVEKKEGNQLSFQDVRARAETDLRSEATFDYVGNLRKQAKIEVDEKAVAKF